MIVRVIVRKARESDLEAINGLTDALHNYLAGLYGLELSAEELDEEHYEEDELENIYVAQVKECLVVGYMSFSLGRDEWAGSHYELEHIVAHKDYRGLGIARKLFDILLERARLEGVNITTGTLYRNERALRFYEKLGFKPLSVGLLLDIKKRILDK